MLKAVQHWYLRCRWPGIRAMCLGKRKERTERLPSENTNGDDAVQPPPPPKSLTHYPVHGRSALVSIIMCRFLPARSCDPYPSRNRKHASIRRVGMGAVWCLAVTADCSYASARD